MSAECQNFLTPYKPETLDSVKKEEYNAHGFTSLPNSLMAHTEIGELLAVPQVEQDGEQNKIHWPQRVNEELSANAIATLATAERLMAENHGGLLHRK